ncbi:MAG TPA: esterase-like activity of phytase family protein [Cyclobacteriaceae bacterium]|nr:esterase-like activity of phytase family protein [Cyclobacteriaceae bacterium]
MKLSVIFLIIWATICQTQAQAQPGATITSLKLLDVKVLPHGLSFQQTTVGGLSGIDFDTKSNQYYLICDDRSSLQPARYYTAQIRISEKGIDTIKITGVTTLMQSNGKPYPGAKEDPAHTPDPEAIRYNPVRHQLIWSSEGERVTTAEKTVLTNPSLNLIDLSGRLVKSLLLPAQLTMSKNEQGPRQNGTLEGLTFADNYKTLYASMEEPLYEDGPRAGLTDNNPWIRIYRFDVHREKNTAQFAYRLEKVAYPPVPSTEFMVNGIPDILSLGNNQLLVIERSFSTGRLPCTVKLFLTDVAAAEDVSKFPSLIHHPPSKPLSKKLLLNMDDLGIYVDNVEGATLGPTLPNGHQTLLLVADDNFRALEQTQFFLFEIIP